MNITIRNFSWSDLPDVVAVINRATSNQKPILLDEIEPHWRAPYNHPERDCFVALVQGQRMIGVGIADLLDTPNKANGVMWYLPEFPAAAQLLLKTTDDYFFGIALEKSPLDASIWMDRSVRDTDVAMLRLLETNGYQVTRRFYTMRIALDKPIEPDPHSERFTVRPIQVEQDAPAVYAAQQEAFQEHWGHYPQPYEEWAYPTTQPTFDPNLWWVALAGEEIVGMVLGEARTADYGWISIVGVRQRWRKQGLALAMLQNCFARFQQRGITHVELGVDTQSAHQAVTLYERAGMHIASTQLTYRKMFRAG